ncbi:MAG TPA: hypothetical protein VMU99_06620 [Acidimicrobiales bacterium]|nr:hypothetical protein [Acidimicrobiales bacterium]
MATGMLTKTNSTCGFEVAEVYFDESCAFGWYEARMVSVPPGSDVVVKAHRPELSLQEPSTVEPFLKVTVPLAVEGETSALNLTELVKAEVRAGIAKSETEVTIRVTV